MTNERNPESGRFSKLTITISGLLGFATPVTLAAMTNPDYSNPYQSGAYIAASMFLGIFTGITGIHYGGKLARTLNSQQQ